LATKVQEAVSLLQLEQQNWVMKEGHEWF
jgi:hypothetical protein